MFSKVGLISQATAIIPIATNLSTIGRNNSAESYHMASMKGGPIAPSGHNFDACEWNSLSDELDGVVSSLRTVLQNSDVLSREDMKSAVSESTSLFDKLQMEFPPNARLQARSGV